MAEASRMQVKMVEEMLSLDKQKSMVSLFSIPETDKSMRINSMQFAQKKALVIIQQEANSAVPFQGIAAGNALNDSDSASAETSGVFAKQTH